MTRLLSTLTLLLALSSCSAIDNAFDCDAICTRYHDCFDTGYDVGACATRCRKASTDPEYLRKANTCDACIDDRSCAAGTFSCGVTCSSIVP
jgi:hypothetical protein